MKMDLTYQVLSTRVLAFFSADKCVTNWSVFCHLLSQHHHQLVYYREKDFLVTSDIFTLAIINATVMLGGTKIESQSHDHKD